MPILLDTDTSTQPAPTPTTPPLRSREVCDWTVTPMMRGMVTLSTVHFMTPGFTVTFTPAALPQLREIVKLLEGAES